MYLSLANNEAVAGGDLGLSHGGVHQLFMMGLDDGSISARDERFLQVVGLGEECLEAAPGEPGASSGFCYGAPFCFCKKYINRFFLK